MTEYWSSPFHETRCVSYWVDILLSNVEEEKDQTDWYLHVFDVRIHTGPLKAMYKHIHASPLRQCMNIMNQLVGPIRRVTSVLDTCNDLQTWSKWNFTSISFQSTCNVIGQSNRKCLQRYVFHRHYKIDSSNAPFRSTLNFTKENFRVVIVLSNYLFTEIGHSHI